LREAAEEGGAGALKMIQDGVLDDPPVEAVTMLHVDPRLRTGTIGVTSSEPSGIVVASAAW